MDCKPIAAQLHARGLSTMTIFLVEMHKPLRGTLDSLITSFLPPVSLVLGKELSSQLCSVLSTPESVEQLIVELEHARSEI